MIYKNKKVKIITVIMMIIFMSSWLFINYSNVQAYSVSTQKTGIENFPDSYKPYLNELKSKHPNWSFVAVYTHLDFNYVVKNEMVTNRSLVPLSYPTSWKLNDNQVESGWVNASESAVSYSLDPRNFLTEEKIFQFEVTTYNSTEHTVEAVKNILKNTPMGDENYEKKYKKNGNLEDMEKSYAEIIVEAGKNNNVSPVHLASRIIQENGGNILNNKCLYGSYPGYEGYYNFMNIGASPSGDGAVINALNYAKTNNWTTPELAINGAAKKIHDKYIYYGQNTVYFEKFDVNFIETSSYLFGSQYMTNIIAPSSESSLMYNAYSNTEKIDSNFVFHIPVYDNMPDSSVSVVDGEYEDDNTLVYLDDTSDTGVTDVFNIRSSPYSNSNDNLVTVIKETKEGQENRTIMTRIKKGNNTGWDKVRLADGREGYIVSKYVQEYIYTKVESVSIDITNKTLKIGDSFTLTPSVLPTTAKFKDVTWKSLDDSIATVDSQGIVTAVAVGETDITITTKDQNKTVKCKVKVIDDSKLPSEENEEVNFDSSLKVIDNKYISGISPQTTVKTLQSKITVKDLTFKVLDKDGNEINDESLVTTETRIVFYKDKEEKYKYEIFIRGDVNCDGKINSADLLSIVQYLKNKNTVNINAADVNYDEKVNSADLLRIVQYLKGKNQIEF